MRIGRFAHKGLERLYTHGDGRRLPPQCLSGERRNVWSLVVTRNWRLTFLVNSAERELVDIDFEDYH